MKRLIIIGLLLSCYAQSLWAACTATANNAFYGSVGGSSNTATVSTNIKSVGDLIVFSAFCYSQTNLTPCTPVSVVMNGQAATRTTVAGSPAVQETNGENGNNGQLWIYYIESAATAGSQTATFAVNGAHDDIQLAYMDFSLSPGCKATHHVDALFTSSPGQNSGAPGTTSNSISGVMGDLLVNFTTTSGHIDGVIASPWSCPRYVGGTETCEFVNTVNAQGYLLNAPSGTTTASWTTNQAYVSWGSLTTSFSLSSLPNPPTALGATVR
jgi:hypothetical protein